MPESLSDAGDNVRCRDSWNGGNDNHPLYDIPPCHILFPPVTALHENVGLQVFDKALGRIFMEKCHKVRRFKGRNDGNAFLLRNYGTARTLEGSHRGVAVDGNDQHVTKGLRLAQIGDMAPVNQIKASVCENNPAASFFQPVKSFLELIPAKNLLHHSSPMVQAMSGRLSGAGKGEHGDFPDTAFHQYVGALPDSAARGIDIIHQEHL